MLYLILKYAFCSVHSISAHVLKINAMHTVDSSDLDESPKIVSSTVISPLASAAFIVGPGPPSIDHVV